VRVGCRRQIIPAGRRLRRRSGSWARRRGSARPARKPAV